MEREGWAIQIMQTHVLFFILVNVYCVYTTKQEKKILWQILVALLCYFNSICSCLVIFRKVDRHNPVSSEWRLCKAMSLRRRCIVGFLLSFFIELSLKVVKLYMTDGIFTLKINISRGEIIIPLGWNNFPTGYFGD